MSTSNSVRAALADGNMYAFLRAIQPDESETVTLTIPGMLDVTATFARIGRTQIGVRGDGDVTVHVHEHEDDAVECYRWNVMRLHRAQDAVQDGPLALLDALTEDLYLDGPTVPVPQRVPGATVPSFAVIDSGEPLTGLYL